MYRISRRNQDCVHDASMVSELIDVILYAFENLPNIGSPNQTPKAQLGVCNGVERASSADGDMLSLLLSGSSL